MMTELIGWVNANKDFADIAIKGVVALVAILGVVFPVWRYLNAKSKEQNQLNLVNFHEKMLGKFSNQQGSAGLEEQVAVVFELRNYPKYFPVTKRILTEAQNRLRGKLTERPELKMLIDEMDLTLGVINKKVR